ncbi:MAG: hypothetical protein Q7T03_02505 [Deltaproteobacteria bacterium]|nr:hypothetical protein [Deltaproteobacteria bacterium]
MKPEDLIPMMQDVFSEGLQSVILYGSAASGHFQSKHSNYNVMVLVENTVEANPLAGQKILKTWLKKNPPPLVWDQNFFNSSKDVFPLEFLELQRHHRILYGKPLPPYEVGLKNLRHQCEMELRTKYIRLQNHPAHLFGYRKKLGQALLQTLPSILVLMDGLLFIQGKTPETDWNKRVEQLAMSVDIHPQVFLDWISIRNGQLSFPRRKEIPELFEAFLTEMKTLIRFADTLEVL